MFVPFLIMLREGLEAVLIISIIASYLKRTKREKWFIAMWQGILSAIFLCLIIGIILNETTGELPQKKQELFEGIVTVIAITILTYMVFWMKSISVSVKTKLEFSVDQALKKNNKNGWTLILMVFLAVTREGLESVFFLLAAFQQKVGIAPRIGAILGLFLAIFIGVLIYITSINLNFEKFFKWSGLFILFVSAGLSAGAIRSFHEAGLWNHFQNIVFDLSHLISTNTLPGTLLECILGYRETPTMSEMLVYFLYLIPALFLFFYSKSNFLYKKSNKNLKDSFF